MIPYIDMHCDTLYRGVQWGLQDIFEVEGAMLDGKRLVAAKAEAQFFAIFFPPKTQMDNLTRYLHQQGKTLDDMEYYREARDLFYRTLERHGEQIAYAGSGHELDRNRTAGKVSAFLTLEDGRAVEGSMERLGLFFADGVRLITLTWNHVNCFGNPNSRHAEAMGLGLTLFGKEAIGEMNRMGMLIDVSHLSDGGFWDVVKLTKKPFVASHSNCRALSPHPRNLTDEMIRALAECGGVAGLNFAADFVEEREHTGVSTVERLALHAKHLLDVGGEDVVAIGSDFDGVDDRLEIADPTKMYLLSDALKMQGFTERQIEKVFRENVRRVIADTI
ncbi:MAG: dipeptidase [Lachnospiraceae bacterium]|nr:dipeptidase [Lachnospiraceae bacterium]